MDIYAGIDAMRDGIGRQAWREVQDDAEAGCRELDPAAADAISSLDLTPFRDELASSLQGVLDEARSQGCAAVYWEFDPENDWGSAFFLCGDYSPEADGDDEWAGDFDEDQVVSGPAQPELAGLHAPSWDKTPRDIACNLFLIGRTVAAFGEAAQEIWPADIPLCAGHHDQNLLFRFVEAE